MRQDSVAFSTADTARRLFAMNNKKINKLFTNFTTGVSSVLGRPWVFVTALALLILWAISGPLLGFSDTWQLIINTSTTIITFLTVFIIQNTQNRDNLAINIKLDALMEKNKITDNQLMEAEDETDEMLERNKKLIQKKNRKKPNSK
jgi:low affinity Fe/Cu permease